MLASSPRQINAVGVYNFAFGCELCQTFSINRQVHNFCNLLVYTPEPLIREKLMSGKMLVCWRHDLTSEVARKRYLQSQDSLRSTHGEIANLFFSEFSQQGSDAETEQAGENNLLTYSFTHFVTSMNHAHRHLITWLSSLLHNYFPIKKSEDYDFTFYFV